MEVQTTIQSPFNLQSTAEGIRYFLGGSENAPADFNDATLSSA